MRAAAAALGIDFSILRDARTRDCPAFRSGGNVHREQLVQWLKENPPTPPPEPPDDDDTDEDQEEDFTPDTGSAEDPGGVGKTLKSLQIDERQLRRELKRAERAKYTTDIQKKAAIKEARNEWFKVSKLLLTYDQKVSLAKRESGELIPLADAITSTHGLLAWFTVAISDSLRNVIPECEGKGKFEIAALLDKELRSCSYRHFKLGLETGKIAEWMGRKASDFVQKRQIVDIEPKKEINWDEY